MDGAVFQSYRESRWFDDFVLGERFELPTREMTEHVFRHYLEASGEAHKLFTDDEFAQAAGLPGKVAHGFQVLIQTSAGKFHTLVEESLISLVEQTSRFAKPVFVGDILKPVLQVVGLEPNESTGEIRLRSTIHNQHGHLVLEGAQRYLLRRRH